MIHILLSKQICVKKNRKTEATINLAIDDSQFLNLKDLNMARET